MMKKNVVFVMGLLLWMMGSTQAAADNIVIEKGKYKITYKEAEQRFSIASKNSDGAYRVVFPNFAPEARYDFGGDTIYSVNSTLFSKVTHQEQEVENEFGKGVCYTFTFDEPQNGTSVTLSQRFYLYDSLDFILTDLTLSSSREVESNFLSPVAISAPYTLFTANSSNRMLKVPYDNDGFGRYYRYPITQAATSYEVTAIYEGTTRNGLIVGSVDHNHWKSAVTVSGSDNGKIHAVKVFSGISTSETRDAIPHGKLLGLSVSSARFFIGFFDDWRIGMESYARANTTVVPRRESWTGGAPFGWQSWGVMSNKNSYETDLEISDYYRDVLVPGSFNNGRQGQTIISLDASDNLSSTQHSQFVKHAKENGQIVGGYTTPFALWWSESDLDKIFYTDPYGKTYTMRDCVLHVNGEPCKYDGAYCLDPTHPATKSGMASSLRSMAAAGFGYVKVDFTSNGIIQADSYYNPAVRTAVEAYNEGMSYFIKQADKYGLFVAFSISPLFPYQYANSRRIACDTWGLIGQTEYSMNALSGGWWSDLLYQFNDPDHIVLVGNGDQRNATVGENRARMTNGVVAGMVLVADNFSLSDESGQGNATLSRGRAKAILMNNDVNEVGRMGTSFMPVYGCKEYNNSPGGAESFFMHHTDSCLYVAVINYDSSPISGTIPYALLGMQSGDVAAVKELWMGVEQAAQGSEALGYSVPAQDARIYRIAKRGSGVLSLQAPGMSVEVVDARGVFTLRSSVPVERVELYDVCGRLLMTQAGGDKMTVTLNPAPCKGLLVMTVIMANGTAVTRKISF